VRVPSARPHDILISGVFSRHHRKVRVLFGLSDILLTALAFEAAYQTRIHLNFERVFYLVVPNKALLLGFSVLVFLAIGLWLQVYDKLDSGYPRVVVRDSLRQCFLGIISIVLFQYVLRLDLSRSFLVLFATYSWVFLCVFRLASGNLMGVVRREFGAPLYVMVVGLGERAKRLGEALERSERYGIRLIGFISEGPAPEQDEVRLGSSYRVYPLAELPELLRKDVIDEILFAVDSRRLAELEEVFLICDEEGVRTRVAVDFFPHVNSRVDLDRLGATPLLTFSATPADEIRLLVKRATDIAVSAAGLLVLLPFMALVAVLVRLTSQGPVIFRQVRCGLNKRWQRRRLRMKPGLTCLWTLAGRDSLDFESWMRMDMQYIDNWSLGLDWRILLRTIPRVLTGKGAY
jgi:hypothetical protein